MSANIATICIPVGTYHESLYLDAFASAQAQTVECDVMLYFDREGRGAGYARNQAAKDTETPFIIFLDADDRLEPTYAEECLRRYERGKYVYTGWYAGDAIRIPAQYTPYNNGGFHLVTTLLPTAAFEAVGGFDETLPGHEDCDLYLKLAHIGICGELIPKPLVHYRPFGLRGKQFREHADYDAVRKAVYERNGGQATIMCCGKDLPMAQNNPGERREGDVLAMALWAGLRNEGSEADPSRVYRGGNGSLQWVNAQDVKSRPDLWRQMHTNETLTPDKADVLKAAGLR